MIKRWISLLSFYLAVGVVVVVFGGVMLLFDPESALEQPDISAKGFVSESKAPTAAEPTASSEQKEKKPEEAGLSRDSQAATGEKPEPPQEVGHAQAEKEFMDYYERMVSLLKRRWIWIGGKSGRQVTVRFGVLENGEIVALQTVRPSGDVSYDESVMKAIRRASPLPPPPARYRKEFMDVELTFRPK